MKKMLLTLALVGTAASMFAQGTIVYYNRITGSVIAPIYGPDPGNPALALTGNTAAGTPAGTQTYAGTALAGTGFSATLWAGAASATEGELVLVPGSLRDFRTGGFAGAINNSGGVIAIPGVGEGSMAALQVRAWDNAGGTITSYADALLAGANAGKSALFTSPALGGNAPPPNMVGLTSFNIYAVPEPSTFVLAGLGAAALLVLRRRK
jgi:hypothetical protein